MEKRLQRFNKFVNIVAYSVSMMIDCESVSKIRSGELHPLSALPSGKEPILPLEQEAG